MRDDKPLRADEVLRRVRATANPGLERQVRIWNGLEARVDGSAAASIGPKAGGTAAAASNAVLPALVLRTGRWIAFGLATGLVGYFWGRSDERREQSEPLALEAATVREVNPSLMAPALIGAPPMLARQPDLAGEPREFLLESRGQAPSAPRTASSGELPRRTVSRARARSSPRAAMTLRDALDLLLRAQSELHRGAAAEALGVLAELERRQPGALLREERLVTRVLALCELGEVARAQGSRQELESHHPASIYRGRLDASCASPPKATGQKE
jgi:hypothetical protein